ncbi:MULTISPECIES: hypothetical protein [Aquitalea]|uniref:hypothetical protein n=1 Tax=Aquitalea TaxID=407217 RepID=UPI00135AA189|nr:MULTISPECIES: hypothetical protein [Aquitalea]
MHSSARWSGFLDEVVNPGEIMMPTAAWHPVIVSEGQCGNMVNIKQNLTSCCADLCSGKADGDRIIQMIALLKAFHVLYVNVHSPEARLIQHVIENLKSAYSVFQSRDEIVLMPYELRELNAARQACLSKSGRRSASVLHHLYGVYLEYYRRALKGMAA